MSSRRHPVTESDARRDLAGVVFARLSVLPALLALPWLAAGFPLLAAGWFRPLPVTGLALVLAVPVLCHGLRAVPTLPKAIPGLPEAAPSRPEAIPAPGRTPWWTVVAVLAIAVAFGGYQVAYHSQFVFFSRDPGAYYQFAAWLADHRSLPIPQDAATFGGGHDGALMFARDLPYQTASSIVMPFMAGLPMVLAGAMWIAGPHAAVLAPPLLGALAIVTFAGLAARLAGPRWAPLAALAAAVSLPLQFTSRSTYSEPLAQILLLGGLSLVIDSLREDSPRRRLAAALGGLLLGLTVLVRIDGASDILPAIPFCGALFARRAPQAAPLALGLAAGAAIGITEGLAFSWPYLMYTNRASVLPLAAVAAVVLALTAAGTLYYRHRTLPRWPGWLDKMAPAAPFLALAVFGVRPYLQHVHSPNYIGHLVRTYDEIALHWVGWYLGIPVILLAAVGTALVIRRVLRGHAPSWTLPLMILAWATVTFLYRPGISPDQPWASRRLVPAVLPAFILLATWTLARAAAWARARRTAAAPRDAVPGRAAAIPCYAALALGGALVVAPPAITNWGLTLSASHGMSLRSDGLGDKRTYQGELSWTEQLCGMLPPNAAVVFLTSRDFKWESGTVRAICGVPVAGYLHAGGYQRAQFSDAPDVLSVVRDIQGSGRVPVLLSDSQDRLTPYLPQGRVTHVPTLHTFTDAGSIHHPPTTPGPITIDVWMWTPHQSLTGATVTGPGASPAG